VFTDTVPAADWAAGQLSLARGAVDAPSPRGLVSYELSRGGRILVPATLTNNGITNAAKNSLLDAWFNSGSAPGSTWGIGLIDGATYTALAATDTIASGGHAGWTEFTSYTVSGNGSVRGPWAQSASSGQAVANSSPVAFDFTGISGTASVAGILVVNATTKGGSTGLLWSTALFLAPLSVQTGDQLRVTYTVQL
jgi:hypothetical protein